MKFDWTEKRLWTLSPRVTTLLDGLDRKITATVVFIPRRFREEPDYENARLCKRLLEQFADESPNFEFEYIDLGRAPTSWDLVKEKFKLTENDLPCVVFAADDRKEVISFDSIYVMEPSRDVDVGFSHSYKGETRFASAIMTLQGRKMPRVYFTTGHGELSLRKNLAGLADQLRANYLEPITCPDLPRQPVPNDCAALLVIGPTTPVDDEELTGIADYLARRNGSMYIGVSPGANTGLDSLLAQFGVVLDDDVVVDESTGRKSLSVQAVPDAWHEVTKSLAGLRVIFEGARSIQILPPPPGPAARMATRAEAILMTDAKAYGETDVKRLSTSMQSEFNSDDDIKRVGGLALAVAYEKSAPRTPYGPPPPEQSGPKTRLIVVGSASHMLSTSLLGLPVAPQPGNVCVCFESVKWLAQTEDPIQIEPLDLDVRTLDKLAGDKVARAGLFWILVIGLPLGLLVCGGVVWLFRRA